MPYSKLIREDMYQAFLLRSTWSVYWTRNHKEKYSTTLFTIFIQMKRRQEKDMSIKQKTRNPIISWCWENFLDRSWPAKQLLILQVKKRMMTTCIQLFTLLLIGIHYNFYWKYYIIVFREINTFVSTLIYDYYFM